MLGDLCFPEHLHELVRGAHEFDGVVHDAVKDVFGGLFPLAAVGEFEFEFRVPSFESRSDALIGKLAPLVGTGTIYHKNECDKKAPSSDEAF